MPSLAAGRWTAVAPTPADDVFRPLVLVVDDHEDSRAIARVVLESGGFRVAEAATGLDGLRLAAALSPAAVLLDLILPGVDGWQVARQLRDDVRRRDTIV